MESSDKPLISWKALALVLLAVIVCFGGYKGYQWAVVEYEAKIETRVEEELAARTPEIEKAAYEDGRAAQAKIDESRFKTAGWCGYVAGYYTCKLGQDCVAGSAFFENDYRIMKDYIPRCDYNAISEEISKEYAASSNSLLEYLTSLGLYPETN